MAKALLGYSIGTDPRVVNRLAGENRILRQRVADLEEIVLQAPAGERRARRGRHRVGRPGVARDASLAHS